MQTTASIAMVMSKFNIKLSSKTVEPLTFSKGSLMLNCDDGVWIEFTKRTDI